MFQSGQSSKNSLDIWDIRYFISHDEYGYFSGMAEVHFKGRMRWKTTLTGRQQDHGLAISVLRARCNAWIADRYKHPLLGETDLEAMWLTGWVPTP
jgi:hypothetical protein